jgi:tight adherence protein B
VLTLLVTIAGPLLCAGLAHAAGEASARHHARAMAPARQWRLPTTARAWLARALRDADVPLEPEQAVELAAAGGSLALASVWLLLPGLLLPAGVVVAAAGPIALRLAADRRERRAAAALPALLEVVASELRGGGTIVGAVARVAGGDGPLAADFRRVDRRLALGSSLDDALAAWPEDRPLPSVRAAAGAFAVAATLGGRAADAIDGLAASLRSRIDAVAEARALSAQARLSAVVVGCAPLGYLVFAGVVDHSAVSTLTGTSTGRVCLVVGLALEVVAATWIRGILRSEAS